MVSVPLMIDFGEEDNGCSIGVVWKERE